MSNKLVELLWPITALKRALVYGSGSTSFPSIIPTTTLPATVDVTPTLTANVFVTRGGYRYLALTPFGTGDENTTFIFKVFGWSLVGTLYVPHYLGGATVTLGAAVGVAGATVIATERFGDTLVTLGGPVGDSEALFISPISDHIGQALIPTRGHEFMEVVFDLTGATNANVLYRYI